MEWDVKHSSRAAAPAEDGSHPHARPDYHVGLQCGWSPREACQARAGWSRPSLGTSKSAVSQGRLQPEQGNVYPYVPSLFFQEAT